MRSSVLCWWRISAALLLASALAAAADPHALTVTVIDGEGAFNDIRRGEARAPVVEVHDSNGRPVEGARVVFQLPDMGASGTFPGSGTMLIATTDAEGRATATGLRPNKTEGAFTIAVVASKDGDSGQAEIRQSNTLAGGDPTLRQNNHNKLKIFIAVAGAAAGVAVAAALHGGGGSTSSSSPSTAAATTLSVGSVTVGGPR